jgi:plastocyanin
MRRLLVLLPLSLLLAACGGTSSTPAGAGPVQQTIQISEKEYSLNPGAVSVSKTGTYEFRVTNNGTIAHALEIEGNGVEEKSGDIQPGASATLRATLTNDGSYDLYCPIDGHRSQGMKGTVTVGSGSGSGGTTTNDAGTTTSRGYGY